MTRVVLHAMSLLLGATVALTSITVHRSVVLGLPVGLLLAGAATVALVAVLRTMRWRVVVSYAVGWVALFGFAVAGRSEGDYAVAGDLRGYALMAVGLVVVASGVSSLMARDSGSVGAPPIIFPRD